MRLLTLGEITVQVSILILLISLVRGMFRRRLNPNFQYFLWAFVALRILLPVGVSVNVELPQALQNTVIGELLSYSGEADSAASGGFWTGGGLFTGSIFSADGAASTDGGLTADGSISTGGGLMADGIASTAGGTKTGGGTGSGAGDGSGSEADEGSGSGAEVGDGSEGNGASGSGAEVANSTGTEVSYDSGASGSGAEVADSSGTDSDAGSGTDGGGFFGQGNETGNGGTDGSGEEFFILSFLAAQVRSLLASAAAFLSNVCQREVFLMVNLATVFNRSLFLIIWLAGCLVVGAYIFIGNIRLNRKLRANRRLIERLPDGRRVYSQELKGDGVLLFSAGVFEGRLPVYSMPGFNCLAGLRKPAIYIDADKISDTATMENIIRHELQHYRVRDNWWQLVRALCLILQWFHPLVWWAYFVSRRDCELACDARTVREMSQEEKYAYGQSLLAVGDGFSGAYAGLTTSMGGGRKFMEERIRGVMRTSRSRAVLLSAAILGLVLVLACVTVHFYGNGQETASTQGADSGTGAGDEAGSGENGTGNGDNDAGYGSADEGQSADGDDFAYYGEDDTSVDALTRLQNADKEILGSLKVLTSDTDYAFDGRIQCIGELVVWLDRTLYRDGQIQCIEEMEKQEIRMYGCESEDYSMAVAIEIDEEFYYFEWEYTSSRGELPSLFWNEDRQWLLIACTALTGTGVSQPQLHILRREDDGGWVSTDWGFWQEELCGALPNEKIDYMYDQDTGLLTLYDVEADEAFGSVTLPEGTDVTAVVWGDIYEISLGDTIYLSIPVGYVAEGQVTVQYEDMPLMVMELILEEKEDGSISLTFGEISAHDQADVALAKSSQSSGTLLSQWEYPQIYEQAAALLEERTGLLEQLLISDNSYLNSKFTITADGNTWFLLTKAGYDSWSDYEELAARIYADSYVANQFAHDYADLYEEADGRLYRAMADGFVGEVDEDSIRIYSEAPSSGEYVITATASTGTAAGGELQLSFGVRVNESKPWGLEIVDEISIERSVLTTDWAEAYIEYILENMDDSLSLGYALIYLDDDQVPELVVSIWSEAWILNYAEGTVSSALISGDFSYVPYENLLLGSGGSQGLYTDELYSILDGQTTLTATGYWGLWVKTADSRIEWSGVNEGDYSYLWNGEEMSEEEYAQVLEEAYPSGRAVSREEISFYSLREMIALLNEEQLSQIGAAAG